MGRLKLDYIGDVDGDSIWGEVAELSGIDLCETDISKMFVARTSDSSVGAPGGGPAAARAAAASARGAAARAGGGATSP